MVNDTICEVANVLINGASVMTINSESTEIEDIKKTLEMVGLENSENINYLQAIKRGTSSPYPTLTPGTDRGTRESESRQIRSGQLGGWWRRGS